MARLLVAEQVACTANVQIVGRKLESCAQTVEIAQDFQTFRGALGHRPVRRRRKIGVSTDLCATDASSQLVELRQPEPVSPVNDHCVGGWYVEPAFDDGRRKQHIVLAIVERRHAVLYLGRRHLAVRCDGFHLGHFLG